MPALTLGIPVRGRRLHLELSQMCKILSVLEVLNVPLKVLSVRIAPFLAEVRGVGVPRDCVLRGEVVVPARVAHSTCAGLKRCRCSEYFVAQLSQEPYDLDTASLNPECISGAATLQASAMASR